MMLETSSLRQETSFPVWVTGRSRIEKPASRNRRSLAISTTSRRRLDWACAIGRPSGRFVWTSEDHAPEAEPAGHGHGLGAVDSRAITQGAVQVVTPAVGTIAGRDTAGEAPSRDHAAEAEAARHPGRRGSPKTRTYTEL